jgi:hypothetical protein
MDRGWDALFRPVPSAGGLQSVFLRDLSFLYILLREELLLYWFQKETGHACGKAGLPDKERRYKRWIIR